MSYLMESMTVEEVREALGHTRTAILPVGGVEQHGYHLPLTTDVYNAYEIARRVAPLVGCLVAPPVTYSFSGGELPGTLDISPQVFSLMLMDIMRSLAHLGVENIVVLMGHGGTESMRAARDAADMFLRRGPHYRKAKVAVVLFADLSPSAQRAFREGDYHSGYLETSLMLYWHPELVRDRSKWAVDSPELRERLRKDPDSYLVKRKPVDHPMVWPVAEQDPDIRVGVMGEPERSDPEFGRKVTEECVEALVELIKKMETAPEEGR